MSSMLIETPGTLRPMLRLTIPVLAEQMLHLLVGFTDMWLTGNLLHRDAYVAAMALMIYVLWLVANLFAFVALGATAMTARFVGAGDMPLANRVMNQSITSGAFWSVLLMIATLPFTHQFVHLMGLTGTAAAAAEQYLFIELCVLPAVMIERVGIACLRGAGDTMSGLVVMGIVNVINMALSYALAAGTGPLPELGWQGIALGTAIGHCCGAAMVLALLIGGRYQFRLRLSEMRPDFPLIRRILRIGVPGGIDATSVNVCNLAFLRVILQLGDVAAAAHGVAIQIEAIGFMPGGAFQIAASTMTGQYLGAGDLHRARRGVLVACGLAAAVMVAAGIFFYVAAAPLSAFFLGGYNSNVVPVCVEILHVISFAMLPLSVTIVLVGALRGAGDTRWPLAISLFGFLAVRIPLAVYLVDGEFTLPFINYSITGLGLGVVGAWYAMTIDIIVRALLLAWRFFHGGWQRIEV
jgi:putative MATE family efflux protein